MSNIIKPKRSNTAGLTPTTSNLSSGELGVNMADQKVYINNGTSVVQIGAGNLSGLDDVNISAPTSGQSLSYNGTEWVNSNAGSGDVVGASSSTDNALVRFDGTTGKLIQNGVVTQDDNGTLANVNAITLDTTPTSVPTTQGTMFWDSGNGTPSIVLNADVDLQVGQEMLALVYNGSGSTITNGSVVAVSGAQGQRPSVVLADADSESLSAPTLGIATEDIANGAEGFVTTFGFVRGLNTSAFTAGLPIYLSQTAGQFTQTRPSAPAHTVALGWVIKVNASSGEVFVNINNGWELDELHNVLITSPTSGNTLIYDASVGVWKNANLTDGTGISITEGAGSISIANTGVTSAVAGTGISVSGATGAVTVTNTAPDQTVVLTAGTGISTSGTYPNFTISNTGVTSVGATSPIASSGGATPTISISQASSTTNGYLSSTDWNTFNNKGTGTVTSIATGTGLSGGTITSSGTISLANTAVTAGSYTNANITVDAQGRITTASNGTAGGVTSIAGTANEIDVSASTGAVTISLPATINANLNGNANTATTATNQSGGTVSATTGSFSGVITSTVATGTAPLTIASTTAVTNLNADYLDGQHGSYYQPASTAITTSNIGSQSVNYATSAGSATNATNATNATLSVIQDTRASALTPNNYADYRATYEFTNQVVSGWNTAITMQGWHDGYTAWQIWGPSDTSPTENWYLRSGVNTSWNPLRTIIHSGNIGSQSVNYATTAGNGGVTSVNGSTGAVTVSGGQFFGSASTKAIAYNANSISENITVTAGNNGLSAGPITINTGYTVTVQTGANWVIV